MPITINGSTGIAGVDGSAATPAVQGTDSNSGIYFTGSQVGFSSDGSGTTMTIDSSGNVTFPGTVVMSSPYAMRNKIINGAMEIYQRASGIVTLSSGGQYTLDRWVSNEDTDGTMTVRQTTNAPVGYKNAMYFETGTADASLGATQYVSTLQQIEGFNILDLAWGTSSAKPVTLSFWVRSSLTGTFGGAIRNGSSTRSYPFSYTISVANTYEYKTITIAGDTTGTWATDNTAGLLVIFGLGVGSTYSGTAGAWASGNYISVTGAVSVIGTASANFYITGVQLEVGTTATPFERRLYPVELALCQRYFQTYAALQTSSGFFLSYFGGSSAISPLAWLPITMRTTPTLSFSTTALQYYSYAGVWTNTTLQGAGISDQIIYLYCASDGDGRGKLIRTGSSGTGPIPVISVSAEL